MKAPRKAKLTPFGVAVKVRLAEINKTQRQLAAEVGVNENYLTDILRGRRPGTKYRDRILKKLGLDENDLDKIA